MLGTSCTCLLTSINGLGATPTRRNPTDGTTHTALEDSFAYSKPADWFYPVRHYLGAALLDRKQPKDAEKVFRADLERNPENGWALFGLWQALEAQKRRKDAATAKQRFDKAWSRADFQLSRAAF